LMRAELKRTLNLNPSRLVTTAMAMRCEEVVCVVSILLDVIF
jgi:hypothetical protein